MINNYKDVTLGQIEYIIENMKVQKKPEHNIFGNIFKKILFFTNSRENNKSLKIIKDAIKNIKNNNQIPPKLFVFEVDKVWMEETDGDDYKLMISDGVDTINITDESNVDTLVFSRLSVQDSANAVHIVTLLQDRGFLVLNPIRSSKLAMNKYDTAVLLAKANIPQPNFSLVTKDKIKDEKEWNLIRKSIHGKDLQKDNEKNEDLSYVCKILNGHGGTGVFMCKDKQLMAILQTIFAIDPEIELLLQRKEEADGGDIRVHVLTLKNKQIILGSMKRVKIGGDFRSNISLGATAESITLTKEQEEIALNVAKLSKLPWCAVDIMPLVKGSNKDLGDNVVLEINSSPGTEGISDVLEENFMNIIISQLDNPAEFDIQEKICGYKEAIYITPTEKSEPIQLLATVDTGNGSCDPHFEVEKYEINGKKCKFTIKGVEYEVDYMGESDGIKVGGKEYRREVVNIYELRMGNRKIHNINIAIVTDRNKSTNALINRNTITNLGYVVSASKTHILTPEIEKVAILGD